VHTGDDVGEVQSWSSHGSVAPVIGADDAVCGVADSGMWPSPAKRPDVGSSPIQPAPGTYTSAQACRSVKSAAGPDGPSSASTSEGQLHQVAGYEAGGVTQLAQDRHQKPRRVATRTDASAQRVIRRLHTGFHPHAVADVGVDRSVERDKEVDGAGAGGDGEVIHPRRSQIAGPRALVILVDRAQIWLEVFGERLGGIRTGCVRPSPR